MKINEIYIEDFLRSDHTVRVKFNKDEGYPSFITGPNGYGKTIILDLIYGLLTEGTIPEKYTDICSYIKLEIVETVPHNKKYFVEWRPGENLDVKKLGLSDLIKIYRSENNVEMNWMRLFSQVCKYNILSNTPKKLFNDTLVNLINREAFYVFDKGMSLEHRPVLKVRNDELLVVVDDEVIKNKEFLGSGTMRLLNLLVNMYLTPENGVLLIDEIERGLHLSTQMEMLNVIKDLCPNRQLIITTHSPSIFNGNFRCACDLYSIDRENREKTNKKNKL